MNEQRAFTVVVTGCKNCPYFDKDDMCEHPSITPSNWRKAVDFVRQNKDTITPSCPMYDKSKLIGAIK